MVLTIEFKFKIHNKQDFKNSCFLYFFYVKLAKQFSLIRKILYNCISAMSYLYSSEFIVFMSYFLKWSAHIEYKQYNHID